MFLGKAELNGIEVFISKAFIGSYISHDKFVSVNNVLREFNEMKEEIKNQFYIYIGLKNEIRYARFLL